MCVSGNGKRIDRMKHTARHIGQRRIYMKINYQLETLFDFDMLWMAFGIDAGVIADDELIELLQLTGA